MNKIPVILDTDIGGDIDDTWALAMLLKCPELDLKLVVSDTGDTEYRAKICAKFLERAGHGDIPVGIGLRQESDGPRERQRDWVKDYKLEQYPGGVRQDGVDAIIEIIENNPSPVTLICIGPSPNIAEALHRSPEIAKRTNFTGMFGSINKQHGGIPGAIAEFNVVRNIPAAQAVFAAPWKNMSITPLDTCGVVRLTGNLYQRIANSSDPVVRELLENYRIWLRAGGQDEEAVSSTILFDTVAVHMAYSTEFLKMQKMMLTVRDDGFLAVDDKARQINVAINWLDLDAYHEYLVKRLLK